MRAALKRLLSRADDDEPDVDHADEYEPVIVEFRLSHRPFIDANGWETVETWPSWERDPGEEVPLTRGEFRAKLLPEDPMGYYRLFPVDENKRLHAAEWGLQHGSKAKQWERKQREREQRAEQEKAEEESADAESSSSWMTQEMWEELKERAATRDDYFGVRKWTESRADERREG